MSQVPDKVRPTITTRLGVSLPTAVGALLFAGAVTFGSGMVGAPTPGHSPSKDATGQADLTGQPGQADKPDKGGDPGEGGDHGGSPDLYAAHDYDKPHGEAPKPKPEQQPQREQPKPESQPQPDKPKPPTETKPKPAPTTALQLQAESGIGKVKLAWSKFTGAGFGYYKVVRSTDATVTWPMGADDTLVGYTHDPYTNWFKDFPPCGTAFHYAVFAVKGDAGYQLLAASNVVSATAQCEAAPKPTPAPRPEPSAMALSATLVDGAIHLDWEECTGTGFVYYKVVRSLTNPNPTYPLGEGTELVAAIGDATVSALVDGNVASGQTWHYRVLSFGSDSAGTFLLGMTPVVSVTVP